MNLVSELAKFWTRMTHCCCVIVVVVVVKWGQDGASGWPNLRGDAGEIFYRILK